MTYLVDANILSEATKRTPNPKVIDWLRTNERNLVVDSIVLGELCIGVLMLPAGRRRAELEQWFEEIVKSIRCLQWDAGVGRRWAKLVSDLKRKGKSVPILDGMIASTALQHGLTVATRNASDFRLTGVNVINPFV